MQSIGRLHHAVQWIRTRLKAQHIHSSWATLQFERNQWHRITTIMPKDRRTGILLKKGVDPASPDSTSPF